MEMRRRPGREDGAAAAAINTVQLISGAFGAGLAGVVVNMAEGGDASRPAGCSPCSPAAGAPSAALRLRYRGGVTPQTTGRSARRLDDLGAVELPPLDNAKPEVAGELIGRCTPERFPAAANGRFDDRATTCPGRRSSRKSAHLLILAVVSHTATWPSHRAPTLGPGTARPHRSAVGRPPGERPAARGSARVSRDGVVDQQTVPGCGMGTDDIGNLAVVPALFGVRARVGRQGNSAARPPRTAPRRPAISHGLRATVTMQAASTTAIAGAVRTGSAGSTGFDGRRVDQH